MRTKSVFSALSLSAAACAFSDAAITVNSHGFNGVTSGAISTSGRADWGFISVGGGFFDSDLGGVGNSYNNTPFGSLTKNDGTTITTVSGAPTIGSVTLTEGTAGTNVIDPQTNVPNYTFGGIQAQGSYGNFAPNEQDVWRMTFNDLGIGRHTITLYLGHSATTRVFDMDVTGSGLAPFTSTSPQIGTLGSTVAGYGTTGAAFTYEIDVTVSAAGDDLTLTHGGISGSAGGAIFSGYTVTTVPEPATAALLAVAGMFCLRRRRQV